jgi:hypothetical protein
MKAWQPMKSNLITMAIAVAVLMVALWARRLWAGAETAHGRYYLMALVAISSIVALITILRLIRQLIKQPARPPRDPGQSADRPRQHYRIQFEHPPRPRYVQKSDGPEPVAEFTCPVRDVSETGMSLDCAGIFAKGETVQGEIIFSSGRTAPVNGIVIREDAQRTCLRLHCTIDPTLLMAEQREQIIQTKDSGPQPAVSDSVLGDAVRPLPSHRPKGLCRLKRS